ncbi:MAG: rod shape-determining protein MreD [Treponema sp.]|nr:MAG: rod shape-determining protein MreD [Treponema sp.]
MVKVFSVSTLILLIFAMVETAILSNLSFLPAVPDLVLLASLYIVMMNGKTAGVILGFVSGLILDFITGCPFGYNCLLRTLICYFAGFFNKNLNLAGFFIPFLIGLCGTFAKVFITWLISLFYPNTVVTYSMISVSFFTELLLNSVLAPMIFKITSCFNRYIALDITRGDF